MTYIVSSGALNSTHSLTHPGTAHSTLFAGVSEWVEFNGPLNII